ncbi:MAG: hypothetical protein WA984_10365 [Phormidesmis sp.]
MDTNSKSACSYYLVSKNAKVEKNTAIEECSQKPIVTLCLLVALGCVVFLQVNFCKLILSVAAKTSEFWLFPWFFGFLVITELLKGEEPRPILRKSLPKPLR